eukprot:1376931-Pleurochrysis_carterae.AAC.4
MGGPTQRRRSPSPCRCCRWSAQSPVLSIPSAHGYLSIRRKEHQPILPKREAVDATESKGHACTVVPFVVAASARRPRPPPPFAVQFCPSSKTQATGTQALKLWSRQGQCVQSTGINSHRVFRELHALQKEEQCAFGHVATALHRPRHSRQAADARTCPCLCGVSPRLQRPESADSLAKRVRRYLMFQLCRNIYEAFVMIIRGPQSLCEFPQSEERSNQSEHTEGNRQAGARHDGGCCRPRWERLSWERPAVAERQFAARKGISCRIWAVTVQVPRGCLAEKFACDATTAVQWHMTRLVVQAAVWVDASSRCNARSKLKQAVAL